MKEIKKIDLTGQRFGRLLVKGRGFRRRAYGWLCQCDCGTECTVVQAEMLRKKAFSCGCLRREIAEARKKHGYTGTKEYRAWQSMKNRCYGGYTDSYIKHYQERGITVCDEWMHNFSDFLSHVGPAPTKTHTIDRIDNDGNYEPGNVRWATPKEQCANKRMPRMPNSPVVLFDGKEMILPDAYRASGSKLKYSIVLGRIQTGWVIERALFEPKQKRYQ